MYFESDKYDKVYGSTNSKELMSHLLRDQHGFGEGEGHRVSLDTLKARAFGVRRDNPNSNNYG